MHTRAGLSVRLATAAVAASTALAVAVYVVARVSMAGAALVLLVVSTAAWGWAWRRLPPAARRELGRRARAGVVAGVVATAVYNLVRWGVVEVFGLALDPFLTIGLFGRLLVGDAAGSAATVAAGVAFHVANGVGLAVAFAVLFGGAGWKAGMAWATLLEVVMVALYPSWFEIRKIDEFLTVTFVAHLAYGATLAEITRRRLAADAPRPAGAPPGAVTTA